MARHSNNKQQVAKTSSSLPSDINNNKQKDCPSLIAATEPVEEELDRKITLAIEGFTTMNQMQKIAFDLGPYFQASAL